MVLGAGVALVAGWLGWKLFFAGFPFPGALQDQPRIETRGGQDAVVAPSLAALGDLDAEMAVYGVSASDPTYLVSALRSASGRPFERLVIDNPPSAGFDIYAATHGEVFCLPDARGPSCGWIDADLMVTVTAPGGDLDYTRHVTATLRRELG